MFKYYVASIISVQHLYEKREGSGTGSGSAPVLPTNGSGSGSPKNMRIRIPNTACYKMFCCHVALQVWVCGNAGAAPELSMTNRNGHVDLFLSKYDERTPDSPKIIEYFRKFYFRHEIEERSSSLMQCCESGSVIRCLLDTCIKIRDEHPGSYFRELRNNFLG